MGLSGYFWALKFGTFNILTLNDFGGRRQAPRRMATALHLSLGWLVAYG
jgi:hypothetical protein